MAGLKRKDAPKSSKPGSALTAKKLKVWSQPAKPSLKPRPEPDDLEESDTTEDDGFGGFSEDDNASSTGTEEVEMEEGGTKVPDVKAANGSIKTIKANADTNGAGNCMQTYTN